MTKMKWLALLIAPLVLAAAIRKKREESLQE